MTELDVVIVIILRTIDERLQRVLCEVPGALRFRERELPYALVDHELHLLVERLPRLFQLVVWKRSLPPPPSSFLPLRLRIRPAQHRRRVRRTAMSDARRVNVIGDARVFRSDRGDYRREWHPSPTRRTLQVPDRKKVKPAEVRAYAAAGFILLRNKRGRQRGSPYRFVLEESFVRSRRRWVRFQAEPNV